MATPQPAAASSSSSATTTTTPFATSNVTTDPSLLPKAGETFFSPYDALSAVNPAATPRPIWDTGIKESSHFADGKVPDLWSIEYLWEKLDQDTRDRTIAHLTERSQGDWKDLSLVEKKAREFILSFFLHPFFSLLLLDVPISFQPKLFSPFFFLFSFFRCFCQCGT